MEKLACGSAVSKNPIKKLRVLDGILCKGGTQKKQQQQQQQQKHRMAKPARRYLAGAGEVEGDLKVKMEVALIERQGCREYQCIQTK